MKKKGYETPKTFVVSLYNMNVLCVSDVTSGIGINYGGVDDEGVIIPSARKRVFLWENDFDWE